NQQQAFVSAARDTSDNLILQSCAGSGKTTTIKAAARETPNYSITAFNKRISDELKKENFKCSTYHAAGMQLWKRMLGVGLSVNQDKLYDVIRDLGADRRYADLGRLVSLAMNSGVLPANAPFAPQPEFALPDV